MCLCKKLHNFVMRIPKRHDVQLRLNQIKMYKSDFIHIKPNKLSSSSKSDTVYSCKNKTTCLFSRVFVIDMTVHQDDCTWHISVMVSSNTPPASSAPSPTSLTFQARDGSLRSDAFSFTTCLAICTKMGLHFLPL